MKDDGKLARFITVRGERFRVWTEAFAGPDGTTRSARIAYTRVGDHEVCTAAYRTDAEALEALREGLERHLLWVESVVEAHGDPARHSSESLAQLWVAVVAAERLRLWMSPRRDDPNVLEAQAVIDAASSMVLESADAGDAWTPTLHALNLLAWFTSLYAEILPTGAAVSRAVGAGGEARASKIKRRNDRLVAEARARLDAGETRKQVARALGERFGLKPRTVENILSKLL